MKYYILVILALLTLTGCDKKLAKECNDYLEQLDNIALTAKRQGMPESVIDKYNLARTKLYEELIKLDEQNQIRVCSLAKFVSPKL